MDWYFMLHYIVERGNLAKAVAMLLFRNLILGREDFFSFFLQFFNIYFKKVFSFFAILFHILAHNLAN